MDEKAVCIIYIPAIPEEHFVETRARIAGNDHQMYLFYQCLLLIQYCQEEQVLKRNSAVICLIPMDFVCASMMWNKNRERESFCLFFFWCLQR